ncbi:unnamed protein product [Musa acuminata var. zebrina]
MKPADTSGSGRIPAIRRRGRWPAEGISKMYLGILDLWVWALSSQTLLHLLLPCSRKQTSQMEIQGLQLVVTRQHSAAVLTLLKSVSLETFVILLMGRVICFNRKRGLMPKFLLEAVEATSISIQLLQEFSQVLITSLC